MTIKTPVYIKILFALTFLLSSCTYLRNLGGILEPKSATITEKSPSDSLEHPVDTESIDSDIIEDLELEVLSTLDILDSTAKLIEAAKYMMESEQFTMAGYWFALSKSLISNVTLEDVKEYTEYYEVIISEINNFYTEYVAGLDELPDESPPEAVIEGIDIESDSLAEKPDSMGVVFDGFDKGVIEFTDTEVALIDSTGLIALLDTVKRLPNVPLIQNKKVNNAISFFQNKGRKVFTKWLERGETYIPILAPILEEEGLPHDLVYIAMIESGFNPKAYSYAHASGPWQFISSTGKIFGLDVGWWYDERRDPIKSTRAAAMYLKKLYTDFDDWYLALASYNCGENKVKRHVKKYKTRDFWNLKRLPRQTRNYVPTYIAATIMAKNPEKYGFKKMHLVKPQPSDSILIEECVDLKALAKIVDVHESVLSSLNPAITRWCTPPNRDKTWIYIPHGSNKDINAELKKLPPEQKRKWIRHRVKQGEALSTIASRYGTTMRAIIGVPENKIRNRHRIRAGKTLLIPVPSDRYKKFASLSEPKNEYLGDKDSFSYKVRKGDNLSRIASRFGVSVSSIRRWNKLYNKRYIHPGQILKIWTNASSSIKRNIKKHQGPIPEFHIVEKGDNPWVIAEQYGIAIGELLSINNLGKKTRIKPGQKLKLPGPPLIVAPLKENHAVILDDDKDYYLVRSGDNLWDIAKKLGTTVETLKSANGIKGSGKIRTGDRLIIPVISAKQDIKKEVVENKEIIANPSEYYTVKRGDTLWGIAKEYNVTIAEIRKLNNIENNKKIRPGDKLVLP